MEERESNSLLAFALQRSLNNLNNNANANDEDYGDELATAIR